MTPLRHAVIEEAKSWIGTPFHDGAKLKGVGVDCGQFVAAVFENCGWEPIKIGEYKALFFMHQCNPMYIDLVRKHSVETAAKDPGNIAMYRVGKSYGHGCIIVEWPMVIHAGEHTGVELADATQGRLTMGKTPIIFDPFKGVEDVW
jgi:hypothetical protein